MAKPPKHTGTPPGKPIDHSDDESRRSQTVESDSFDRMMFGEMLDESPMLQNMVKRGEVLFSPFGSLLEDIFASLYKYNIRLNEPESVFKSNLQNRKFVEQVLNRPEYQELRRFTILNEPAAAMGASSLAQSILAELEKGLADSVNQMHQQEQALEDAQADVESLEELLERFENMPSEEAIREQLEEAQRRLEEAQQQYNEAADNLEEQAESAEAQDSMQRSLEQGFDQALEDVKENMELMEGFGEDVGSPRRMSVNERLVLAKKLKNSEKLKKLAKMVGKFKRLAIAQQKKRVTQQYEEMYDVMQGKDLQHLIPHELQAMHHPILKKDFRRRFVEGKLLQYNLRGEEERGKGALVVCIDGSYSMEGEKELWSKAVTLAMLDIATRQKRDFRAIHFGSKKDPLKVMEFPKGERSEDRLEKIGLLAEYFIGGGTDFEKPLQAAISSLEEASKQRGDIVFITDGDCVVSPRWLSDFKRVKERLEVSVFSILVDMGINTPATVKEFSDKVTTVSRLTSEEVKDIFAYL